MSLTKVLFLDPIHRPRPRPAAAQGAGRRRLHPADPDPGPGHPGRHGGPRPLGIAQTGTGKTAAFALPILHRLAANRKPRAAQRRPRPGPGPDPRTGHPDRRQLARYGKHLGVTVAAVIFGGVKYGARSSALASGVDVLVATPGRLLDHPAARRPPTCAASRSWCSTRPTRCSTSASCVPIRKHRLATCRKARQNLFFSATMPTRDRQAGRRAAARSGRRCQVTPQATTVERIDQQRDLRRGRRASAPCWSSCSTTPTFTRTLVFTRTKRGADRVAKLLCSRRRRSRLDPRRQEPGPTRTRAGRSSRPARSAPWWPPTSPPAASTSTRSATWSTTSCRTCRKPMSTASAAPAAPAPTGQAISLLRRRRASAAEGHPEGHPPDHPDRGSSPRPGPGHRRQGLRRRRPGAGQGRQAARPEARRPAEPQPSRRSPRNRTTRRPGRAARAARASARSRPTASRTARPPYDPMKGEGVHRPEASAPKPQQQPQRQRNNDPRDRSTQPTGLAKTLGRRR